MLMYNKITLIQVKLLIFKKGAKKKKGAALLQHGG